MAAQEISDYLKNGNIAHSVNMPEVHQPRAGGKRICIIHKNEPGMISQITARHPGAHPVTRRSSPNLFIRKEPPPARAAALCGSGGKKYLKK